MKIAVSGKGGVGKTTLCAILARLYADEGRKVLAADVDPDANLGIALGFSAQELAALTPISQMRALIAERTGASAENFGKFFKINPKVDDIPDRFALEKNGVKLLVNGHRRNGRGRLRLPRTRHA
jgi:CO dehydrogenase maturation factor